MVGSTQLLAWSLLVAATAARAQSLDVADAWARATPPGATTGAAYLTVTNTTAAEDRLVAARSDVAREAQLHATRADDGMMKMLEVDALAVPRGGSLVLEPGGYHIMFVDLVRALTPGDVVRVTLVFERAGARDIELPVRDARAARP